MLSSIALKNYKAFSRLPQTGIKPVTVLCGSNSCGKTSTLQSLLLLKQTLESNYAIPLLFDGPLTRLCDFQTMVHGRKTDRIVEISHTFDFTRYEWIVSQEEVSAQLGWLFPQEWLLSKGLDPDGVKLSIEIRIEFDCPDINPEIRAKLREQSHVGSKSASSSQVLARALREANLSEERWAELHRFRNVSILSWNVECCFISTDRQEKKSDGFGFRLERSSDMLTEFVPPGLGYGDQPMPPDYLVSWNHVMDHICDGKSSGPVANSGKTQCKVRFQNLIPIGTGGIDAQSAETVEWILSKAGMLPLLKALYSGFSYVGPLREEPSRQSTPLEQMGDIGVKGENAPYVLFRDGENLISYWHGIDSYGQIAEMDAKPVADVLQYWLRQMGISEFGFSIGEHFIDLRMSSSSDPALRVGVQDVGFGISQVYPIILEGIRLREGRILMLEQPEIHLHPALQMNLADFLICQAMDGKGAIVETHSDHLVNRLVRRIVEDETDTIKNLVDIVFVSPGEDGSKIEQILIDPLRGILNWPHGFFDQAAMEQGKIIRAGIKRRESARS